MIAARWHGRGDVRVERVDDPAPTRSEVLLEVEWCGICGTDLEEYLEGPISIPTDEPHALSGRTAPIILGHEFVGRVVQAAADGSGPAEGAAVVPDVVVGCGACFWCKRHQEGLCERLSVLGLQDDGGLATYVAARADTCLPIPEKLAMDAAALAEPTAVAVRAARKLPTSLGARVVVIGAGTIGLLVVQVLRSTGADRIVAVDPDSRRRALALELGADESHAPEEHDDLCDAVIECSGAPGAAREAVRRTRAGGTAILVGFRPGTLDADLVDCVLKEKRIVGSAAHVWDEDVASAISLMARGLVRAEPLITSRIELEQIVSHGFDALADRSRGELKILVSPRAPERINSSRGSPQAGPR